MTELTPERLDEIERHQTGLDDADFHTLPIGEVRAFIVAARKVPELEAENAVWTKAFNEHDDERDKRVRTEALAKGAAACAQMASECPFPNGPGYDAYIDCQRALLDLMDEKEPGND